MSERYLVWMDSTILKEHRTRKERGSTVFEYRLNGGEWKETHRIVWQEDEIMKAYTHHILFCAGLLAALIYGIVIVVGGLI